MASQFSLSNKYREFKVTMPLLDPNMKIEWLIKYFLMCGFEAEQRKAFKNAHSLAQTEKANWTVLWTDDQSVLRTALGVQSSVDGTNYLQKVCQEL